MALLLERLEHPEKQNQNKELLLPSCLEVRPSTRRGNGTAVDSAQI